MKKSRRDKIYQREVTIASQYACFGDENRLRILNALSRRYRASNKTLLGYVTCDKATLSHHMNILMHNRLVKCYRSGREIFYRINDNELYVLADYTYSMFNKAFTAYERHNGRHVTDDDIAKEEIDWRRKERNR